jgi:nucleoside-diphosphate-sugar epimerase
MNKQHKQLALVTGATGFTGSHLTRRLVGAGINVRVLVRPSSDLMLLNGLKVETIFCDLATEMIPPIAMEGVDTVYHIAAAYRRESLPRQYFFDVNSNGTERMLKAALHAGVTRFVHCSTVGVLGEIKNPPATETSSYCPADVYQESKMEGERKALEYIKEHDLPGVIIRPGAIYGPGDTRLLKLFRAIDRGYFWMIGNGENFYHLVYIDDLIDGFILAGEQKEIEGEIFIIAGNTPIKVKELVRLIAEILERPVSQRRVPISPVKLAAIIAERTFRPLGIEPPLYTRRLDFFVKTRAFDISKARKILGYSPKIDLRTGLTRTIEWYRHNNLL